jgi:hypothetical protein
VKQRHWQKFETFQAQFSRAARNLAQREEEPWLAGVTVSRRSWDRWMTGNVKTEPRPDACRVLEHMFGYPVEDLLASASEASVRRIREEAKETTGAPPGHSPDGPVKDQARTIGALSLASPGAEPLQGTPVMGPVRDGTWDVEEMERRELLRLFSGIALAAPLAAGGVDRPRHDLDSALKAPTTAADVGEWERVVHDYGMENGRVAPAVLLPELLTDLDEAQRRLDGAPDALRAPMARVCGYLTALIANNLVNAGDPRSARRYWRTALRTIGESDRSSQVMLYATRARFALAEENTSPSVSLAYADEAIRLANGTTCAGLTSAHNARAVALAILGDPHGSIVAVQDSGDVLNRLPSAEAAPSMFAAPEQALYAAQSRVYSYVGRSGDAAKAQEAGLALVQRGAPLPIADFALNTAVDLIRSGDPSEGARHVVRTVQALPAGYQQSALIRQNATRALELVPAAAASAPAVSEARELLSLPSAT